MTQKEIIAEMKAKGLNHETKVYKLKTIDGNDGSSSNEYFFSQDERDKECNGIEYPYFFERYTTTFKPEIFINKQ
jgi:hypothetical protein